MNKKIVSMVISRTALLLEELVKKENPFLINGEGFIQELLLLKDSGKNIRNILGQVKELDFLLNNNVPDIDAKDRTSKAKKSIYICLENLNDKNQKQITGILARDLIVLGFRRNCYLGEELYQAIELADSKQVKELINKGADINYKNKEGKSILIRATELNYDNLVKELINAGVDINGFEKGTSDIFIDHGDTALIKSIKQNNDKIYKLLINAGADVNYRDNDKHTPLMFAIYYNQEKFVRDLIKRGADIHARDREREKPVFTLAVEKGNMNIIKLLFSKGARVNDEDRVGWTALMTAAEQGNPALLNMLVKAGAKINHICKNGWTPLFRAVFGGKIYNVRILLENKADVHLGKSPLGSAVYHGHLDIIKILIKEGINVNVVDENSMVKDTPLICAAYRRRSAIVVELLKAGADVRLRDYKGRTALLNALEADQYPCDEDTVLALINGGADINDKLSYETTDSVFRKVVSWKMTKVVDVMLQKGVSRADMEAGMEYAKRFLTVDDKYWQIYLKLQQLLKGD
ncbi:MAG: ankyrin repeat domain-containing protein [Candidatus Margulisbacteria bacterium]|nr:ankyrin repeat domain-containing protein [Candidatus Margulisiibacteriota bacterium]